MTLLSKSWFILSCACTTLGVAASAQAADFHCSSNATMQDPAFGLPTTGSGEQVHYATYRFEFTLRGVGSDHVVLGGTLTKSAPNLSSPIVWKLDGVDSGKPGNSLTRVSPHSVLWSNGSWIASFDEKMALENNGRDFGAHVSLGGFVTSNGSALEEGFDFVSVWTCNVQ